MVPRVGILAPVAAAYAPGSPNTPETRVKPS